MKNKKNKRGNKEILTLQNKLRKTLEFRKQNEHEKYKMNKKIKKGKRQSEIK